jgi:predicted TIM-barrel fold metal-dependent hydrolase
LEALCDRYAPAGFAHYLRDDNDGWLAGAEADEVFAIAAQRRLIVSLGAGPSWQADLRRLAGRHPGVPVLCQSLGGIWVHDGRADGLGEVLASAAVPSIHIKLAGCHYACPDGWDYPWPAVLDAVARLHDAYGPHRLCWGSDFPAGGRYCTYRQSLEVARRHCPFIAPEDLTGVLGGNLARLLAPAPSPV